MLLDAAETYDKETFTALIWPEHYHWMNYGLVEELKAEKNKDGGVDLFAVLSPNKMYLDTNSMGQRLFLSMELMANFAKTGKTYLTGLAATDDPASLGTSEMRFSADAKRAGVICANHEEITFSAKAQPNDEAEAASLFRRLSALFSKSKPDEDDDMADKAALEKLQTELDGLKAEFAKLKPAEAKLEGDGKSDDAITKLSKQVEELTAKFEKLTPPADDKANDEIITKLSQQVTDLATKLSKALEEAPGTQAGDHTGGEGDAAKFADIY